ncbi:MAG: hypothetical protein INR62_08465 [Rhodospirillales bacterium]|nr:hypothetical protein [Acetobacter sp.]
MPRTATSPTYAPQPQAATVIPFRPRQDASTEPLKFTPTERCGLLMTPFVLPGWAIEFDETPEGEQGAVLIAPGRPVRIAYVIAPGVVLNSGHLWRNQRRFRTALELLKFVRQAEDGRLGVVVPYRRGAPG